MSKTEKIFDLRMEGIPSDLRFNEMLFWYFDNTCTKEFIDCENDFLGVPKCGVISKDVIGAAVKTGLRTAEINIIWLNSTDWSELHKDGDEYKNYVITVSKASDKYLVVLNSHLFNTRYLNLPIDKTGLAIAKKKAE